MKKILIPIILFISISYLYAEKRDNGNISLEFINNTPILSVNSTPTTSLGPNLTTKYGVQYSCKYFRFSFSINSLFNDTIANSDMFFSYFQEKYGIETYYSKYKNFYITNEGGNLKLYPNTPNEHPNLSLTQYGLSYYRFFNGNSNQAIYSQSNELLKNNLSPFIKASVIATDMNNDKSIIPAENQIYYSQATRNLNSFLSTGLSLSGGLSATATFYNLYFSVMASIGMSTTYVKYHDLLNGTNSTFNNNVDFDFQIAMGYSGEKAIWGFWIANENQMIKINDIDMQIMNIQFKIFIGEKF